MFVEPIEINAGEFYLRALRSDERIDDGPAIAGEFADVDAARQYVRSREAGWDAETCFSWAVCDATTAALLCVVELRDVTPAQAAVACWTHPAHRGRGIASLALNAVLPWAFHGAGLQRVSYPQAAEDKQAQRVAEKCGFTSEGALWSRSA